MKILVVNAGSSSLKYQLLDMSNDKLLAKGNCEKIGLSDPIISYKHDGKEEIFEGAKNHEEAIKKVLNILIDKNIGVIKSFDEIGAIGHRVVMGGWIFKESTLIDDEVIDQIDKLAEMAPLHNPAHVLCMRACKKVMPNIPQVAIFDTSFHSTMPEKAYMYAIPYEYYEKYKIRKYGAHGTSHKFVANRVAEIMGKPIEDLKIISCHLGQGASLCAVDGGKSIDTSMGLTPLAGVPMGSRSGDVDPSVLTYLMDKEKISPSEMNTILNKKSGKLGLSGVSIDDRDIEAAAKEGNKRAQLAIDNFVYQVVGYIGRFAAQMKGVDVITFEAGIGENGIDVRKEICDYLGYLGVKIDEEKNNCRGKEVEISTPDSKVKVYVVPTNEELMIARETMELVK